MCKVSLEHPVMPQRKEILKKKTHPNKTENLLFGYGGRKKEKKKHFQHGMSIRLNFDFTKNFIDLCLFTTYK